MNQQKQNGNIIAIITMFFLFAIPSLLILLRLSAQYGKTNMQVPIPWV